MEEVTSDGPQSIKLTINRDGKTLHVLNETINSPNLAELSAGIQKIKKIANDLLTDLVNEEAKSNSTPTTQKKSKSDDEENSDSDDNVDDEPPVEASPKRLKLDKGDQMESDT